MNKRIINFLIGFLLVGAVLFIPFAGQAKAYTNSLDSWSHNTSTSTTLVRLGVQGNNGGNLPGNPTVGDLVVVGTMCTGTATKISSIDSSSTTGSWTDAYDYTYSTGNTPYTISAWYAIVSTAAMNITVTLGASASHCGGFTQEFNVGTLGFPVGYIFGQLSSVSTTLNIGFGGIPSPGLAVMFFGGNLTGGAQDIENCGYSGGAGGTYSNFPASPFSCSSPGASVVMAGGPGVGLDGAYYYTSIGGIVSSSVSYSSSGVGAGPHNLEQALVLVFGISGSPPPSSGVQNIGSCPTKDVTTTTLTNSTFFYWQTALVGSPSTLNTVSWGLASVSSGTRTVYIALYATAAAGSPSVSNPLVLGGFKQYSLTAATYNEVVQWFAGIPLNVPSGATFAIGIVGDDKVHVNETTVSGMLKVASGAGSIPPSLISSGASASPSVYLCADLSYSTSVTTTVTSTTTSTTGGGNTSPFITNPDSPILFLVLLLPFFVGLVITKHIIGGIAGLMLGAVIAVAAGVLLPVYFLGLLIACVALAFAARSASGG